MPCVSLRKEGDAWHFRDSQREHGRGRYAQSAPSFWCTSAKIDTDLGLRAQWAGWKCWYAPGAVVHHHYSHTAGRATPLKAYYVERNRLFLLVKNFPARNLIAAPVVSLARYGWHAVSLLEGQGSAARFREDGHGALAMIGLVIRAHWATMLNWNRLWRKRRRIRSAARITPAAFATLLRAHAISAREVARL